MWLFEKEFIAFQANVLKTYGKKQSASDLINAFVIDFNRKASGVDVASRVVYESLKEERLQVTKQEDLLYARLMRREVFEPLVALAVSLGSDECLGKNLPDVYKKLLKYSLSEGETRFSEDDLESFLELIECVLKRRALLYQLKACRASSEGIGLKQASSLDLFADVALDVEAEAVDADAEVTCESVGCLSDDSGGS